MTGKPTPEDRLRTGNIAAAIGLFFGLLTLIVAVFEHDLAVWLAAIGIIAASGSAIDLGEYLKSKNR